MNPDGVILEDDGLSDVKFQYQRNNHALKFKILLSVVAVLTVIAVVFIVLYAVEKKSSRNQQKFETFCATSECVFAASGKSCVQRWRLS